MVLRAAAWRSVSPSRSASTAIAPRAPSTTMRFTVQPVMIDSFVRRFTEARKVS